MGYFVKWEGKQEPQDKSGAAHYRINGRDVTIQTTSFEQAQAISDLLDLAFKQGKHFAFQALHGQINAAFDRADIAHGLKMT